MPDWPTGSDPFACPYCGAEGENSYWLIDHVETCPKRWQSSRKPIPWPWPWPRDDPARLFVLTYHVPAGRFISYGYPIQPNTEKVKFTMADLTVRDTDPPATATVALTDKFGAPTTPDEPPTWAEDSNGTVLTIATSTDGMTATFTYVAPGTSNITFLAVDNDGTKIVATGSIEVNPGEAVSATMVFTAGVTPTPPASPTP